MADETRDPASADLAAMPSPDPRVPSLHELAAQVTDLRPLPAVVPRILEITEGERFSAHELATLIANDQALTARLLRLANSAYYGFPRRISTVRDAVVLLGFRAVRSATLAACLVDVAPASNRLNYQQFWHFSVSVGMLAEVLARSEGVHQENAFTAGVLHNIGRLALDQYLPRAFEDAVHYAEMNDVPLTVAERAVLGYSDAELGGALALHWNFPQPLVDAVRNHELDPDALPDPRSLTAFVVRARLFARSYGLPDGIEAAEPGPPPSEWMVPPLSVHLDRAGGVDGIMEKVQAFLQSTITV